MGCSTGGNVLYLNDKQLESAPTVGSKPLSAAVALRCGAKPSLKSCQLRLLSFTAMHAILASRNHYLSSDAVPHAPSQRAVSRPAAVKTTPCSPSGTRPQQSMASDNSPSPSKPASCVRRALDLLPQSPSPCESPSKGLSPFSLPPADTPAVAAATAAATENQSTASDAQPRSPATANTSREGDTSPGLSRPQQPAYPAPALPASPSVVESALNLLFAKDAGLQILASQDLHGPLLQLGGGARK